MPDALQFLVLIVAGWVNRHKDDLIDYLREENRILREQRGPRPLRFTDAQRRRLAVRGKRLGRRALTQVAGIVTPDTILRWYRKLIAQKYDQQRLPLLNDVWQLVEPCDDKFVVAAVRRGIAISARGMSR